jgi:hypothetical protein
VGGTNGHTDSGIDDSDDEGEFDIDEVDVGHMVFSSVSVEANADLRFIGKDLLMSGSRFDDGAPSSVKADLSSWVFPRSTPQWSVAEAMEEKASFGSPELVNPAAGKGGNMNYMARDINFYRLAWQTAFLAAKNSFLRNDGAKNATKALYVLCHPSNSASLEADGIKRNNRAYNDADMFNLSIMFYYREDTTKDEIKVDRGNPCCIVSGADKYLMSRLDGMKVRYSKILPQRDVAPGSADLRNRMSSDGAAAALKRGTVLMIAGKKGVQLLAEVLEEYVLSSTRVQKFVLQVPSIVATYPFDEATLCAPRITSMHCHHRFHRQAGVNHGPRSSGEPTRLDIGGAEGTLQSAAESAPALASGTAITHPYHRVQLAGFILSRSLRVLAKTLQAKIECGATSETAVTAPSSSSSSSSQSRAPLEVSPEDRDEGPVRLKRRSDQVKNPADVVDAPAPRRGAKRAFRFLTSRERGGQEAASTRQNRRSLRAADWAAQCRSLYSKDGIERGYFILTTVSEKGHLPFAYSKRVPSEDVVDSGSRNPEMGMTPMENQTPQVANANLARKEMPKHAGPAVTAGATLGVGMGVASTLDGCGVLTAICYQQPMQVREKEREGEQNDSCKKRKTDEDVTLDAVSSGGMGGGESGSVVTSLPKWMFNSQYLPKACVVRKADAK